MVEPAPVRPTEPDSPRGLPLDLRLSIEHGEGTPQLAARLQRARYPLNGPAFAPLRLPEQVRLLLQDVDGRLLHRGTTSFEATLVPGTLQLPLAGGEPFLVEVSPATKISGQLQFGAPPGATQPPARGTASGAGEAGGAPRSSATSPPATRDVVLHGLELRFDPPLALTNVLNTLVEVQHLFEDRKLAALLQRWQDLPGLDTARSLGTAAGRLGSRAAGELRRRLGTFAAGSELGALLDGQATRLGVQVGLLQRRVQQRLEQLGEAREPEVVLLERVTGRLRRNARLRQWELELSFSGHIRWFDRVLTPFTEIVLPAALLPVLHASLERLLSTAPLASGQLDARRFAPLDFARRLLAGLQDVDGHYSVELELPRLQVSGEAVDRTQMTVQASIPAPCQLSGSFRLAVQGEAQAPSAPRYTLRAELPDLCLGFSGHPEQRLDLGLVARAELDLGAGERPLAERLSTRVELDLRPGSHLPLLELQHRAAHPFAHGATATQAVVSGLRLEGGVDLAWGEAAPELLVVPARGGLSWSCQLSLPEQTFLRRGETLISGSLRDGTLAGSLQPEGERSWCATVRGQATLLGDVVTRVTPIAELKIEDSTLRAGLEASVDLDAALVVRFPGPRLPELSLCPGGAARVTVLRGEAELDRRRLELPPALLTGTVRQAELTPSGAGDFMLDVAWNLHGRPVLLRGRDRTASLLTRELRQGELTLHVSPGGRFWFSGDRQGLYGVRFFNSLLKPASDPGHLLRLLRSDDALSHVVAALEVFNPELADQLQTLREVILGARTILDSEGVRQPSDLVPRAKLARLLSLLLVGHDGLADRIAPIYQGVTEGRGLDVEAAKELLRRPLAGFRCDYEVDGLLRWLDLVVRPSEPLPGPESVEQLPMAEDPRWADQRAGLPSAAELYAAADQPHPDPALVARTAELAPYLTLPQLEHLLGRFGQQRPGWADAECQARLLYVREVKQRVARIAEGYGGMEFAGQDSALASFLGEAVGPLPALDSPGAAWPPPCALGPEEVATLLQAGLAAGRQGMQAQIHNRLLTELIRARPGEFLLEVLVELGQHSHRALSGVLFALLHQDQDQMQSPVDLVELVGDKLQLPVPRQEDYLAGGRRAKESYYEALGLLAEQVFDRAGGYLARRAHLREVRHPVPAPLVLAAPGQDRLQRLADEATAAIAEADRRGQHWLDALESRAAEERSGPRRKGRRGPGGGSTATDTRGAAAARDEIRNAYAEAFAACGALLAEEPRAFELPFLRTFWARNEEALRALSVVRNHQEDADDVRRWLALAAGRPELQDRCTDEQELLRTVILTLWPDRGDQQAMLADPLVRLLLDPPAGAYDFTIVTAMGVITDGERGHELEDAFGRLQQRRGVRIVRAHTGLFRSLEFNAERILEAIARVQGPWGYIGYSQGCANGLLAETTLRGGTPEQQRMLERFVSRNLLMSAANGSVHGTSGSRKFVRAMIEGERFLKHYQASYSRQAVDLVLRGLKASLDSAMFVDTLDGTYSLTLARARWLHRDGQFAPWASTVTTRGVVTPDRLPEALEYLYYVHRILSPGVPNDSQVACDEAVGHSTRVKNAQTEAFARAEIPSRVQATHHWSPLTAEIEMVTTERDVERGVYQGPKDRHVFPWVDTLARFGLIRRG